MVVVLFVQAVEASNSREDVMLRILKDIKHGRLQITVCVQCLPLRAGLVRLKFLRPEFFLVHPCGRARAFGMFFHWWTGRYCSMLHDSKATEEWTTAVLIQTKPRSNRTKQISA